MISTTPKISVIMSVYNDEKYLRHAIASILDQTFKDLELIIVNDASTDKSLKIIKSFKDPRVVLIQNKKNLGLTESLNKAIEISKGKYIARMDADDESEGHRLQMQFDFLEKNENVAMCGTGGLQIDEEENIIGEIPIGSSYEEIIGNILFYNQFIHPSLMFRREVIENAGLYNETYLKAQDYDLILRLLEDDYKLESINEPLMYYRNYSKSVSNQKDNHQELFASNAIRNFIERKFNTSLNVKSILTYRNILLKAKSEKNIPTFISAITDLKKLKEAFSAVYKNEKTLHVFNNTLERIINTQFKTEGIRKICRIFVGL